MKKIPTLNELLEEVEKLKKYKFQEASNNPGQAYELGRMDGMDTVLRSWGAYQKSGETTKKRKIIQICAVGAADACLGALCDDGSLWFLNNGKWHQPKDTPQDI